VRFASLASGSRGNCLVAEAGGTRVLIDCGLSPRETARRLARLGVEPAGLSAVLVTHEHEDHVGGAFALAAAHSLTVYLTRGTLRAAADAGKVVDSVRTELIDGRRVFAVGALEARPFTVPHDAREPVQFVLSDGAFALGVLTDIGGPTPHVVETLSGCDALVLECNHDRDMLQGGGYPGWLKQRIGGPLGHLDNEQAAGLLGALDRSRLRHVIGAHLSQQNNRPQLARAALARALGCAEDWVGIASQDEGFGWRELRAR
jgi:phosphoribosyl 1,2-cyclic phosphodiesterase